MENLTAFEAVLADMRQCSPDSGSSQRRLSGGGSSPIEIVDRIRSLGWQGVMGNTDEMLVRPNSLEEFASQSSAPPALWQVLTQIALATRSTLGDERMAWLRELPRVKIHGVFALVHDTPESCWRAPAEDASDAELKLSMAHLASPSLPLGIHIALSFAALPQTQDS
jgi:hypothetical protein